MIISFERLLNQAHFTPEHSFAKRTGVEMTISFEKLLNQAHFKLERCFARVRHLMGPFLDRGVGMERWRVKTKALWSEW